MNTIVGAHVDAPVEGEFVHRHGFNVVGWFFDDSQNVDVIRVEAQIDNVPIGFSRTFYDRSDVRNVHVDAAPRCGFEFLCTIPEAERNRSSAKLDIFGVYADERKLLLKTLTIRFSYIDYRMHGHGYMFTDDFTRVLRRDDVYGSGPPSPVADGSCVNLVMRYIDAAGTVLDVGCGIGAYGKQLLSRGIRWHGVEVVPWFCERMTAEGLPNTLVEPGTLPFADQSFDSAISIEVLEHIDDYDKFLREISRVVRGTVCFSVPNAEGIPLLSYMHALPWHMLESDHKNFFSRGSLRSLLLQHFADVEVFTYGNLPRIRSFEGVPLPNHLFAVARSSRLP